MQQSEEVDVTRGIGATLDDQRDVTVYRIKGGDYVLKFINKNNVGEEEKLIRLTEEAALVVSDAIRAIHLDVPAHEFGA
jgi:hypothetical protein